MPRRVVTRPGADVRAHLSEGDRWRGRPGSRVESRFAWFLWVATGPWPAPLDKALGVT